MCLYPQVCQTPALLSGETGSDAAEDYQTRHVESDQAERF